MQNCWFCGDETENTMAGRPCCERCEQERTVCGRCGDLVPSEHTRTVSSDGEAEVWCLNCSVTYATDCECCGDTFRTSDMTRIVAYGIICMSCWGSNSFFECSECGRRYHINHESEDYGTCSDCYDDDDRLIHSFDYKPKPVFFGDGPHFGVELEVNTNDVSDDAYNVQSKLGDRVYLKHDGSIGDGFEIVTHPHSLEEHYKLWNKWNPPDGMTSYASGRCGIHVHISRKGLTQLQIGKILVFLNDEKNQPFMAVIAQRTSRQWAKVSQKKISDVNAGPDSRYQALNLCNHNTIEVRIFRGNTRKERILKAIEFCAAMRAWVKTASCQTLTAQAFTKFVADDKKAWPNLWAYMVEKNLTLPVKGREVKKVEDM